MRNKLYLIGIVATNLEITEYKPGKKRAFFTLIIDESYKNEDGIWVYKNTPVNLVAWDHVAEIVEKYVNVNDEIAVEAKIRANNYKNQKGYMIYSYKFTVTEIFFLSGMYREKYKIETQEV